MNRSLSSISNLGMPRSTKPMSQYINQPHARPSIPGGAQRGVQTSGLAVASMVLGIVSVLLFFLCFVNGIFGLVGLILGGVSVAKINGSGGMLKGKGMAITGIILSLIGIAISVAMVLWIKNIEPSEEAANAPKSRLSIAERNIQIGSEDRIAFGNSSEAADLAQQFADRMKKLRDTMFTSAGDGFSVSGGNFLTHCELHDDSVAFLVHVPKLRKFDQDAKDGLCDIAWMVAHQVLEGKFEEGKPIVVGVKGFALYEQIIVGHHYVELDKANDSVTSRDTDKDVLEPFFPNPEPPAEESATASEAAAPSVN